MAPSMPLHRLGKSGPLVPAVGFGAMGLGCAYGDAGPDTDRYAVLDAVVEEGCGFIDSANVYGDVEDLIGRWLKERPGVREKIVLSSKIGLDVTVMPMTGRGSPEYIKTEVNRSLERLGTNLDMLFLHRIDPTVPIETSILAMKEFVDAGKVKHLGLSEPSAKTLRRAHAVHPIAAVQMEYSPFALEIEREEFGLLKTARELGVAIVCYAPLGRGMLTGKYRSPKDFQGNGFDFRAIAPRFSEENFPKNLVLVDRITEIAKKKGVTPAQLTLAWTISQGEDFVVIPGSEKVEWLKENAKAGSVVLGEDERAEIRTLAEAAEVHGAKWPEGMDAGLFGDSPELK